MACEEKIKSIEELAAAAASLRAAGKRIVQCHGIFDLLHIGTIRYLEQAKRLGDVLLVTLTPDEHAARWPARVLFAQSLRAEAIAAVTHVDYVAVNPWPLAGEAIRLLRPDVYVPCDDESAAEDESAGRRAMEAAAVREVGGALAALDNTALKPAGLVRRRSPAFPAEAGPFLASFSSRYSCAQVLGFLEKARSLRVLFVGEAIIDEYQYCETIGKSGKEPVLAARYISAEQFAGGILATANQAAAFSDHVGMVTVLGSQDSHEPFIREKLDPKIEAHFLCAPGARTIVKRRLVEVYPFQKLFEIYVMDPGVSETVSQDLCARLKAVLPKYDAVVVTDYGHGMLTPEVIDLLCRDGPFLAVNTQTNAANQGFNTVSKYRRADCICLSEKELRLEARNPRKDLTLMMAETAEKLSCKRMVITRGRDGGLCYHAGEGFFAVPAFTNRIVDRIGAGDALLAVSALCAARGAPMEVVGFVGNAVGAEAVETVGNRNVVTRDVLRKRIESLLGCDDGGSAQ
jgi:cytidyltransferase-like protein